LGGGRGGGWLITGSNILFTDRLGYSVEGL